MLTLTLMSFYPPPEMFLSRTSFAKSVGAGEILAHIYSKR